MVNFIKVSCLTQAEAVCYANDSLIGHAAFQDAQTAIILKPENYDRKKKGSGRPIPALALHVFCNGDILPFKMGKYNVFAEGLEKKFEAELIQFHTYCF